MHEAVRRRFLLEQAERTHDTMQDLLILMEKSDQPVTEDCYSILKLADYLDGGHEPRLANAHWHISYFSDQDKDRITNVMQKIGCDSTDYTLYPSIDDCIRGFKK